MPPSAPAPDPDPDPSARLDLAAHLDEQLAVERVRAGDALALEAIFTAYHAELLAVATRIVGSRAVAEEVLQDVFLAIWTGRERWHVTSSLGAYLHRAVRNVAARTRTSRTRGASLDDASGAGSRAVVDRLVDGRPTPDVDAERAELSTALRDAARAMPRRMRQVLLLRWDGALSNREIAATLGLSVKTVETHVTRAFAALREQVRPWRD